MSSLKVTVAGIRGIIGESLTPGIVLDYTMVFASLLKEKTIIIGTDTRVSHNMIKHAVVSALLAMGKDVIDIGIVATPTVQLMVRHAKAAGGIMITASHNPIMWNGLKFISSQGIFLDENEMHHLFMLYDEKKKADASNGTIEDKLNQSPAHPVSWQQLGQLSYRIDAVDIHFDRVCKQLDLPLIRSANLSVVVDVCNGAGALLTPRFLERLGVAYTIINSEPNGKFAHSPEPLPENLGQLKEAVLKHSADIGFAQDADADRLAIVNEAGEAIGEDYTLVLVMDYILSTTLHPENGHVATNLSTTQAFADVANKYGSKVIHTKIGEVNVSKALMKKGAIVGGEGNGGVIVPSIGLGRDSFAGIGFMLQFMAASKKTVSELVHGVPQYKVVKARVNCTHPSEISRILEQVKNVFSNEVMDLQDGVKVIFKDSWLHVRASNTEPILRYFAEAKTYAEAQALIDRVLS